MIKIHTLWVGSTLSTLELLSIVSHIRNGHEYHLWRYADIANVPDGVILEDATDILPESEVFSYQVGVEKGSYSACSNIFRYKLLHEVGGWWCDTDVVALKPFDFPEDHVFASERTEDGGSHPTTCVIKTPAGSHVAGDCYRKAVKHNKETLRWGTIGPQLLAETVRLWGVESFIKPPATFCPADWFDSEHDPSVERECDTSTSYAVHLWNEMWRRKGIDKDEIFKEGCLYERLKRAYLYPYPQKRRRKHSDSIGYL